MKVLSLIVSALIILVFTLLKQDPIRIYTFPKSANVVSLQNTSQERTGSLHWHTPSHWVLLANKPLQLGHYQIPNTSNSPSTLSITAFPGNVGSLLANINRWRNQLQLPPLEETAITTVSHTENIPPLQITWVDLASNTDRLIVAIIPFQNKQYFFKLIGPKPHIKTAYPDFKHLIHNLHTQGHD